MSLSSLKYLTLVQLRDIAQCNNISFSSNIRKTDLIKLLEENLPKSFDVLKYLEKPIKFEKTNETDEYNAEFHSASFDVTNDDSNIYIAPNKNISSNNYSDKSNVVFPTTQHRFGPGRVATDKNENIQNEFLKNEVFDGGKKFRKAYSITKKNINEKNNPIFSFNKLKDISINNLIPNDAIKDIKTYLIKGYVKVRNDGNVSIDPEDSIFRHKNIRLSEGIIDKYKLKNNDYIEGIAVDLNSNDSVILYLNSFSETLTDNINDNINNFELSKSLYPNQKILNDSENNLSIFVRALDIISPIAYGQKILLLSERGAGITQLLLDFSNNIHINSEDELVFVSINSPKEEQAFIKDNINGTFFGSEFSNSPNEHVETVIKSIDHCLKKASLGKNVIIVLDNLSQFIFSKFMTNNTALKNSSIYTQDSINFAKKIFSYGKSTENSGTITIITAIYIDNISRTEKLLISDFVSNSSVTIYLDKELSNIYKFPAIDFKNTVSKQIEKVANSSQYDILLKINRIFKTISNKEAYTSFIDLISKTKNNKELRNKLPEWFDIWEKICNY